MQCFTPLKAYRTNDNSIIFSETKEVHTQLELPCGQCIGCRLQHAETWAIRMVHEAQTHEENSFVTLTYDDENLPPNGLQYSDVTKFIKKLRRVLDKTQYKGKLKYYRVGEYGDKFSRPHYHLIIFGFDFSAPIKYKGIINEKEQSYQSGDRCYYNSSLLTQLWDHGRSDCGDVDYSTCNYVAKYVTKKVTGKHKDDHYQGREPEKASMSKKPPIGYDWLQQFNTDVYPHDHVLHNGRFHKVPRAYDTWLEKNNPELYDQIKQDRENNTKTTRQEDLTRIHNTKILKLQNSKREHDSAAPINDNEYKRLAYMKMLATKHHNQRKNDEKNVHSKRPKSGSF